MWRKSTQKILFASCQKSHRIKCASLHYVYAALALTFALLHFFISFQFTYYRTSVCPSVKIVIKSAKEPNEQNEVCRMRENNGSRKRKSKDHIFFWFWLWVLKLKRIFLRTTTTTTTSRGTKAIVRDNKKRITNRISRQKTIFYYYFFFSL